MKRIAALVLVAAMCLTFASCKKAQKEMKNEIVGEWMAVSVNASVVFNEDGTGELQYGGKHSLTWKYDPELDSYTVAANQMYQATFGKEYDMECVNLMGIDFYSFDDYDKAYTLMLSRRCEDIVELTADMTKIQLNTTYDLANGVTIRFTGISVVDFFEKDALQLDYEITNNCNDAVSGLSAVMNGKYYLANRNSAVTSAGNFEFPSTIAAGETASGTQMFDFGEDPKATVDTHGMVIGAVVLELYGQNCYIDLSDWFKKSN